MLINPITGQPFGELENPMDQSQTGKIDKDTARAVQESFLASYKAPSPLPEPTNPVTSGTPLREEVNQVKSLAADGLKDLQNYQSMSDTMFKDLQNFQSYNQTEAGKQATSELDAIRKSLGMFTTDEEARVAQAGKTAGQRFDPLISEAQEQKQQGMPRATVGAGERGGFMNTQYAGAAALSETQGGNFVGAGGELENIQGVYDRNISMLKSEKERAIGEAEMAARRAIETGKREDYEIMEKTLERARQTHNDELSLIQEKIQAISAYEQMSSARIDRAFEQLDTVLKTGAEVPKELIGQLDGMFGEGFVEKFKEFNAMQVEAMSQQQLMENSKMLVDILSKVPENQTLKIGDAEYSGLQQVDPKKGLYSFTETNASGRVTQVTTRYNPETGQMEIVGTTDLGLIGKPMARTGGSGGGGDKRIEEFRKEAAKQINEMEREGASWAGAFDTLRVLYPEASNELINQSLGGGIEFNSETGEFGDAWGRATR